VASKSLGVTFPQASKLLTPIVSLRPLSAQSDARLVELVGAGNERAFEALARRYRHQLLVYAARLLGAESRAEDALQQALMQAWIALRDGAEVAEVRPWLYRIVHNSAVTMLRRARHDTVELNEALDAAAPETGAESRLVLKDIFAGISVMPEPQRQAILLTAVAGNSHGETAAALGLTDGAVRGLVYRARSALRQAAAALSPVGLWNWTAGLGGRRGSLAADAGDVAGAAGTATGAAVVMKGGAILAAAGALAGAGQAVLPGLTGPDRQARVVHHQPPHRPGKPVAAARTAFPTRAVLTRHGGGGHGVLRHESREGGSGRRDESSERHGVNGDRGSGRGKGSGPQRQGSNGGGPANHEAASGEGGPGSSTSSGSAGSDGKSSGDDGSRGGSRGSGDGGGGVTSGSSGSGGSSGSSGSSGDGGSGGDSGGPSGTGSSTSGTSSSPSNASGGGPGTSGGSGSDGGGQPTIAQPAPSESDLADQVDGGSGGSDGSGGGGRGG
jgi:RNA polymerase sigma factor (sigma-70 family)